MQVVEYPGLEAPELQPYRTLRRTAEQRRQGLLVAEGKQVVDKLLESGCEVVSILTDRRWFSELEAQLLQKRFEHTTVFVVPSSVLTSIVGFPLHQNIMAIGKEGPNVPLEHFARSSEDSLLVALEGITDAENMGMIVRNCAAFGVTGLVVGGDSTSPFMRRSIRVSQGAVFSLQIHRSGDLHLSLARLRGELGFFLIGTVVKGGTSNLSCFLRERPARLCLVFGSEGSGLSKGALKLCQGRFTVPMASVVDSLNVANAAAVILYEVTKALRPPAPRTGASPRGD